MNATAAALTAALTVPTAPVQLTVPSSCSCRYCPECLVPFAGHACECGSEGFPDVSCQGCILDACEHVGVVAQQWYLANPSASSRGWDVAGGVEDALAGVHGPWEQKWVIEPWAGGRLSVEVWVSGERVACLTVLP